MRFKSNKQRKAVMAKMNKGSVISGKKTENYYVLRYKGPERTWHRVPAESLEEAKGKMLKGTRYTYDEIIVGEEKD